MKQLIIYIHLFSLCFHKHSVTPVLDLPQIQITDVLCKSDGNRYGLHQYTSFYPRIRRSKTGMPPHNHCLSLT